MQTIANYESKNIMLTSADKSKVREFEYKYLKKLTNGIHIACCICNTKINGCKNVLMYETRTWKCIGKKYFYNYFNHNNIPQL